MTDFFNCNTGSTLINDSFALIKTGIAGSGTQIWDREGSKDINLIKNKFAGTDGFHTYIPPSGAV